MKRGGETFMSLPQMYELQLKQEQQQQLNWICKNPPHTTDDPFESVYIRSLKALLNSKL
jgi:hypothetical protein